MVNVLPRTWPEGWPSWEEVRGSSKTNENVKFLVKDLYNTYIRSAKFLFFEFWLCEGSLLNPEGWMCRDWESGSINDVVPMPRLLTSSPTSTAGPDIPKVRRLPDTRYPSLCSLSCSQTILDPTWVSNCHSGGEHNYSGISWCSSSSVPRAAFAKCLPSPVCQAHRTSCL